MREISIFIHIVQCKDDEFAVYKNSGGSPEEKHRVGTLSSYNDAYRFAEQLQGQAGGSEKATILIFDQRGPIKLQCR